MDLDSERMYAEVAVARPDPWRLAEWRALPERCGISGCGNEEADQRGPLFMRDGSMHKLCPDHWEPVMRVLGEQRAWLADAHHSEGGGL